MQGQESSSSPVLKGWGAEGSGMSQPEPGLGEGRGGMVCLPHKWGPWETLKQKKDKIRSAFSDRHSACRRGGGLDSRAVWVLGAAPCQGRGDGWTDGILYASLRLPFLFFSYYWEGTCSYLRMESISQQAEHDGGLQLQRLEKHCPHLVLYFAGIFSSQPQISCRFIHKY